MTEDETITSETASSSENLTEERTMELDRRIKSLGKEKTYIAEEAFSYSFFCLSCGNRLSKKEE